MSPHEYRVAGYDGPYLISSPLPASEFSRLFGLVNTVASQEGRVYVIASQPCLPAPDGQWVDVYARERAQHPGALAYVGYTTFEAGEIDQRWVRACNDMDEIWVLSEFNRQAFARSGVDPERLHVVPFGLDAERFSGCQPLALPDRAGFNFLSIFQYNKRKGCDVLLAAYAQAFGAEDDVALVVRSLGAAALQEELRAMSGNPAKLVALPEALPEDAMPGLYAACDAFVLPSRGEGWGMPYLEAMASGLPVIGTRWGGNLTFMTDQNSFLIDVAGWCDVPYGSSDFPQVLWGHRLAEPSVGHLATLMRQVYEDRAEAHRRAGQARQDIATLWTRQNTARLALARLRAIVARNS